MRFRVIEVAILIVLFDMKGDILSCGWAGLIIESTFLVVLFTIEVHQTVKQSGIIFLDL